MVKIPKTEVISFRDFMNGSYKKIELTKSAVSYSILPTNLFGTMFGNEMTLIMLGIGAVFVGLTIIERVLAKRDENLAELVSIIASTVIPLIAIGMGFWLISYATQLFL
ncbi:hypothetical protein LRS37_12935 [Neobacillus sedimentimangrovi]|uniref:Yip1 domain-containing protein n=1 Tax=Neobacillus sedimentimangrovi TaxID=2699460 RepID=A0ABS8QM16_9BACI|nr:hypothetical protein [Neobacillus sedimentimangrovi]MCD4839755.1 hypothetical protein [Neobacillus sedimentimangrovi]